MLLECAIGDAFGVSYEYNDKNFEIYKGKVSNGYVQNPKYKRLLPGQYSDDTQMSLAIAECLLQEKEWTPYNIVKHFLQCFIRDYRPDAYAQGFKKFLEDNQLPRKFLKNIKPDSERSGASMRSGILGIIPDIDEAKEKAIIQAEITHKTKKGVDSAVASTVMSWYLHNTNEDKSILPKFLKKHVPGYYWNEFHIGKIGILGLQCVKAALTSILLHDNISSILEWIATQGGDTDTTGAIALTAISSRYNDIPENLLNNLENNAFGKDYLIATDKKICEKFNVKQST